MVFFESWTLVWGLMAIVGLGSVFAEPNCLKKSCGGGDYQYNLNDEVCVIHGEKAGALNSTCESFQACFKLCKAEVECGCTRKRIKTQGEAQAAIKEWKEELKSEYAFDCYVGKGVKTACHGTKKTFRVGCVARESYLNCYHGKTQCDEMDGRNEKYKNSCCCQEEDCNENWKYCMNARESEVHTTTNSTISPNATTKPTDVTPKPPSTASIQGGFSSFVVAVVVVVTVVVELAAF